MFFLQAYCRLDYVKIMKVKTEDMLSDSLTKVMPMPKHHVQKCGLRDLNIALAEMVFASQVAMPEAVEKDRFPCSETFVIHRCGVVLDRVVHGHVDGHEVRDLEETDPSEKTSDLDDRDTDGGTSQGVAERDLHHPAHRAEVPHQEGLQWLEQSSGKANP